MKNCGDWILKCLDCSQKRNRGEKTRDEVVLPHPMAVAKSSFPIIRKQREKKKKEFKLDLYKCEKLIENQPKEYDSFRPRLSKTTPYKDSNEKVLSSMQKTPSLSTFSEIDHTPEKFDENYYRFSCPICFKFFSNILRSKCCKNYFCRDCYHTLKDDIRSKSSGGGVRCIFCGRYPLILEQIDPNSPVKNYANAPLKILQGKMSLIELNESGTREGYPEDEPDRSKEIKLASADSQIMSPYCNENESLVRKPTLKLNYSVPKNPFKECIDSYIGGKSSTNHSSPMGSFIHSDHKRGQKSPLMPSKKYDQKFGDENLSIFGYSQKVHHKSVRSKIFRDSLKTKKKHSPLAILSPGSPLRNSLTKLRSGRKIKYY
ncbi:unnamed protein product [Moneuplotes crassus]|uniref:RING-type domain-containing protein n=1 Tax=Euplotes crassus TaxID=5936 RepID=A0AAD1UQ33_EUPCR|nr:unnamed protein product [Moneuplotes crassus]